MASQVSRRSFAKSAALGIAAVGIAKLSPGQTPPIPAPPVDTKEVEKLLAQPLSEEAKKLLQGSIKSQIKSRADRLKHPLPDISEPYFQPYVRAQEGK